MVTNRRYALHSPNKTTGFIGIVSFHQNDDGRNFTVDQDFKFVTVSGLTITVPHGFITDLASIPRIFWSILPPFSRYTDGAIVHDFLYRRSGFVENAYHGDYRHLTRKECDGVLLEAMQDCNTPRWQRVVIYRAVRWFGWLAKGWRK